jgi:hypothetical protein
MSLRFSIAFVQAALFLLRGLGAPASPPSLSWRPLQPGVELAIVPAVSKGTQKPGPLYVVRVDPRRVKVGAALASETGSRAQTAGEWCRASRLIVAINLGMFQDDQRSNVGYLRHGRHLNNRRWNAYRSVLALNPAAGSLPAALWVDLESAKPDPRLADYDLVVQNLRLIAAERRNVWSPGDRRWSEAALAVDTQGRLLFLFSRAPYAMRDFNALLLSLPLEVVAAMHLEGGPEASLSIHVPGLDLDLAGSYETGFLPSDSNDHQWPIPNVLGVLKEEAAPSGR